MSQEEARDRILRHLYSIHRKARSPKTAAAGIRELQAGLKKEAGLSQQDVASNLDYLIQKKWVVEVREDRAFQTARGTVQHSASVTFKISDVGIDHLEGASMYQRPEVGSRVNITNIRGVTVVGDGNVVNTQFAPAVAALDAVRRALLASSEVDDSTKLGLAADLDTVQAQLQKPAPDPGIVKRAWSGVQNVVTASELAELIAKATSLLGPLVT